MNKVGLIDIKKAYLGDKSLSPNNAFVGDMPLLLSEGGNCGVIFTSTGSTTISMTNTGNNAPDMKYSLDGGSTWQTWDYSTISLNDGDEVRFKGNNPSGFNVSSNVRSTFVIGGSGTVEVSGNVMGLLDNGMCNTTIIPNDYCFGWLFQGCSKMTSAPELPATTLTNSCYRSMFLNCTSLTTAPALPAATLVDSCYYYMFRGCSLLNYVDCSATDISATDCTYLWLSYVSATGTFILEYSMKETWTIGDSGIPVGWTARCKNYKGLKFTSTGETTISFHNERDHTTPDLKYSLDEGLTWVQWDYSAISLNDGDTVCFKGNNPSNFTKNILYPSQFVMAGTGTVAASGNIMALMDDGSCTTTRIPIADEGFFAYLFENCTNLTTAPELPATRLALRCYYGMFKGCTSLVVAPELPATDFSVLNAEAFYARMFSGCTSLTTAPALPATSLRSECYSSMFFGCTSLLSTPQLPATTLADHCYSNMFNGCTALTSVSSLPATTLALECYLGMFSSCTSLTTAPELPATTLATGSYMQMFRYCSSLNYVKCLATDISASNSHYLWLSGVSSTGTFVKNANMSSWTTGSSGIPSNWTIQND